MKQLDPVRRAESMAHRLRRRIAAALFLRGFLRASGAAWFAAGALVLAVRIFARPLPDAVPWGIAVAALVVSAAIAGCSAAKQLPGIRRLLAWLDGAGASGGLLTASLEVAPGAWRERIVLPAMPKIRTGGAREWVAPAAGAAFLAGIACGMWSDLEECRKIKQVDRLFLPGMDKSARSKLILGWEHAIKACMA